MKIKTKIYFIFTFLVLSVSTVLSQNLFLKWAKQLTGGGYNRPVAISITSAGEVYSTGRLKGIIDLDPGPGTYTFDAGQTGYEPYVCKFDSSGQIIWGCTFK